jgi:hypothetical protein
MDCGQKSFKLVWRCHQLLCGFLVNGHLPSVSRQSHLWANKCDNEIIPGAIHRSRGVYLTVEEFILQLRKTPENLSYETVDQDSATSHSFKWDLLPPNEVVRIAQHVRNGEGSKEGKDGNHQFHITLSRKLKQAIIQTITPFRFRYQAATVSSVGEANFL